LRSILPKTESSCLNSFWTRVRKNRKKDCYGDLKESERWDDSIRYYEEAINETSTEYAPWCLIPADDKEMGRDLVAKFIWEEIQKHTDGEEPESDEDIKANIEMYKDILKKEK
jgi:hypothetical protein